MSEHGYKIRNQEGIYFITFAVVEWIDVFTRKKYQEVIIDSLQFCQNDKGLIIYGWCLMTNHIHIIISSSKNDLSSILRDFKKHTSKKLIHAIIDNTTESRKKWMLDIFQKEGKKNSRNQIYQFWRQENQPKEIITEKFGIQKLEYVHNNPVESGLVDKPEDYLLSSAKDYILNEKGLIEVEFL